MQSATLPKNANGMLGHTMVCYAPHRYLVQPQGWLINGMSLDSSGWNGFSTANPMPERKPAHVQDLSELHLVSRGPNLRELAVLTQVLLNQVSQEYLEEREAESGHGLDLAEGSERSPTTWRR